MDLRVGADILSPPLPKLANTERGKKTGDKHWMSQNTTENNLKIRWKKRPSRVFVYMNHVHRTTRSAKRILLGKIIKKPTI